MEPNEPVYTAADDPRLKREADLLAAEMLQNLLVPDTELKELRAQLAYRLEHAWARHMDSRTSDDEALRLAVAFMHDDLSLQESVQTLRRTAFLRHVGIALFGALMWFLGMLAWLHFLDPTEMARPFSVVTIPLEPVVAAMLIGFIVGVLSCSRGWFFAACSQLLGLSLLLLFRYQPFYASLGFLLLFVPLIVVVAGMSGYLADLMKGEVSSAASQA